MTMKNTVISILLVFACAFSLFGQASMTSTTLSSAIATKVTRQVIVASATGISEPTRPESLGGIGNPSSTEETILFVDLEAMKVDRVSSTTITVTRGYAGTAPTTHASGAKVWVGPASYFSAIEPSGSCTSTTTLVQPVVALATGNIWTCGNGKWVTFGSFVSRPSVGAILSSGSTIAPTNPIHHVSGSTTIQTITVPAALPETGGCIVLIPDGAWSTGTSGNIAVGTTGVVNQALTMCYSPVDSKWYPSYK